MITPSEISIAIGDKPPTQYFRELVNQCAGGGLKFGGLNQKSVLLENLASNCIPSDFEYFKPENFARFLEQRQEVKR